MFDDILGENKNLKTEQDKDSIIESLKYNLEEKEKLIKNLVTQIVELEKQLENIDNGYIET